MAGTTDHLFVTPIWRAQSNQDFSRLKESCLELEERGGGRVISNVGGYQSNDFDLNDQRFSLALDAVKEALLQIEGQWFPPTTVFEICQGWLNVNRKGHKNDRHFHSGATISAVVYVAVPENSGEIVFARGDAFEHYVMPKGSPIFYREMPYRPSTGTVFLFPSWLAHRVTENLSDEPRISIAFNIVAR